MEQVEHETGPDNHHGNLPGIQFVQNLTPSILTQSLVGSGDVVSVAVGAMARTLRVSTVQNLTPSILTQPSWDTAKEGADVSVVQNLTPSILTQPSGDTTAADVDPAAMTTRARTLVNCIRSRV